MAASLGGEQALERSFGFSVDALRANRIYFIRHPQTHHIMSIEPVGEARVGAHH